MMRQLADLRAQQQRLSQPGAMRTMFGDRANGPAATSRVRVDGSDLNEITTRWDSLQSDFDSKANAISAAKQALNRLSYVRDAYERDRDSLSAWLAEERRTLSNAFSRELEVCCYLVCVCMCSYSQWYSYDKVFLLDSVCEKLNKEFLSLIAYKRPMQNCSAYPVRWMIQI